VAWNALCQIKHTLHTNTHIQTLINVFFIQRRLVVVYTADGSVATFNDKRVRTNVKFSFALSFVNTTLGKEITISTVKTGGPGRAG